MLLKFISKLYIKISICILSHYVSINILLNLLIIFKKLEVWELFKIL